MAWGTHAERRAAVENLAKKAEARAQDYRSREASYRAQGKSEKAQKHADVAARQERIATTHRQELDRLAIRAQLHSRRTITAAARAHEMARAEERATEAAAARPEVDPLAAYTEALTMAASLEEEATRAEKRARGYARAGDQGKAAIATGGAERSRQRAAEWRAEAERIQSETNRDLARELTVALKARRRAESQAKNEQKRLGDLGVVASLATAAAQREIATGGRGRGEAIASFRDYAALIRKPQERTQARLQIMERFDRLCSIADAGLFPESKFEHESGSGKGPGSLVMESRAAGLGEMEKITKAIGSPAVAILRAWIYERQTIIAMVRAKHGSEKAMSRLCLSALDALGAYLKTRSALSAALAGMGLRSPPRPSDAASVEAGSAPSPQSGTEIANSAAPQASPIPPETPLPPAADSPHPASAKPQRPTIQLRQPISDDARRTIQARSGRASAVPAQ